MINRFLDYMDWTWVDLVALFLAGVFVGIVVPLVLLKW